MYGNSFFKNVWLEALLYTHYIFQVLCHHVPAFPSAVAGLPCGAEHSCPQPPPFPARLAVPVHAAGPAALPSTPLPAQTLSDSLLLLQIETFTRQSGIVLCVCACVYIYSLTNM